MGLRFEHPWVLTLLIFPAWPLLAAALRLLGRRLGFRLPLRLPIRRTGPPAPPGRAAGNPAGTAPVRRMRPRRPVPVLYGILRGLVVTLLILALAGTQLVFPARHQAVIFVADLSASTALVRAAQEQFIREALAARRPGDVAGVVAVGQDVQIEVPPSTTPRFERFGAVVNPNHTDLERGLRLAAALLPPGYRRRIVLISDGRETQGNVLAAVSRLREQGIRVDVVPLTVPAGPEALVRYLDAPSHLRAGEDLTLRVTLHAGVPTRGILRVYDERTLVETRPVELPAGDRTVTVTIPRPAPGHHRIRVTLEAEPDTLPQNNTAGALVEVLGPPEVLVAEGSPGAGANVAAALRATGVRVTVRPAGSLPAHAAAFTRYASVVLVDVPAAALGSDTMAALESYVREGGGGLVALGGQNSFTMGGWAATPLERLLPVRMEVPRRKEMPSVAVALLIENLEGDWKTDIGKEAAKALVGMLDARDLVAVNDITEGWAVPLQHPTDKEKIMAAIDAMQPGDPPHYIDYLLEAHRVLKGAEARVKHIIAIFDGDAQAAGMEQYRQAVEAIAADGITLSTIHINPMRPEEYVLLQAMARWGGGRYYLGNDIRQVPQILLKEAQHTARPAVVEMDFTPAAVGRHPLLEGLTEFPVLNGYVGTTAKPAAQVVLESPHGDPVLAAWQAGLGRTVAWTSDTQGLWTAGFLRWPGAARFLANLVGWTMPAAQGSDLEVRTEIRGSTARVEARLGPGALAALNQGREVTEWPASLVAVALRPDGRPAVHTLLATGSGRYEGDIPVPEVGPYVLMLSAVRGGESVKVGTTGLLVPYSPEFSAAGADEPLLRQVARLSGGRVGSLAEPAAAFARDLPAAPGVLPLSQALLILAILLWPLDVAVRRLALGTAAPSAPPEQAARAAPAAPPSGREAGEPGPGAGEPVFTQRLLASRRKQGPR